MGERPFECGQCKKNICIFYKEIARGVTTSTEMCSNCPVLEGKLYRELPLGHLGRKTNSLCCGNCGTSVESIKRGETVGCSECYTVFGDILVSELLERDALPPSLKNQVIHKGSSPGYEQSSTLSTQLSSLNEALNEALKRENYEQAALLRDQIKALTDYQDGSKT